MYKIFTKKLDNGLQVIVNPIDSPMATFATVYRYGSVNEQEGKTGWAHLLEHCMFTDTPNARYDDVVHACGGNNNAFTTDDFTFYYVTMPVENIETAFYLEADRMCGLPLFEEGFTTQRNVVIEEFKQRYLNQPYGDLFHVMRALMYTTSMYKYPTIGATPQDVEGCSREQLMEFYKRGYAPDNAAIVISGDVDPEQMFAYAEKYFGGIKNKSSLLPLALEPKQTAERVKTVEANVESDAILVSYFCGNEGTKDYFVGDVLTDILANGASSRLVNNMYFKNRKVVQVDASVNGYLNSGFVQLLAIAVEGVSLDEILADFEAELELLKNPENIEDFELQKSIKDHKMDLVLNSQTSSERADALGRAWVYGDVNRVNSEVETLGRITKDDISEFARRVFVKENRCVLYYKAAAAATQE